MTLWEFYAIATAYGYDDIGADAARSCLNLPFSDLQSSYIRYATAEHISELFRYHAACGQVASALASSLASQADRIVKCLRRGLGTGHELAGEHRRDGIKNGFEVANVNIVTGPSR